MAGVLPISDLQRAKTRDFWKIGDALVLLADSCVVLWTIRYHENWADEAQAWLIARDLDLRTIWFHELRYEGSPGLWHTILWIAQHTFHARYGALSYIGASFAIAGAAVLIFLAPFPRYIRWPLAFTYVMVYQYAVIARPYTLLPLLVFAAAFLFKDTLHPERITLVLILLAMLTAHGTVLAACFGLAYLYEAVKLWHKFDNPVRKSYIACIVAMAGTFAIIYLIVKPTPDVEMIALRNEITNAPQAVRDSFPSIGQKLIAVTMGAFIDFLIPSILLVLLFATWCMWRNKWLSFILPVGAMIAFYASIHGAAHHHGTAFVAAIAGLWIAWPTSEESLVFNRVDRMALRLVEALLLILCAINLWDAEIVIRREYAYPYSGAADAAQYLKSVGAGRVPMFGYLHGVVAVQAYFDHNIFANNPTTFFHHGLPLETTQLNVAELYRIKPEYVVAYSDEPETMVKMGVGLLTSQGYDFVHFSDGYYLYKRGVFEQEVYFIFRRSPDALADWPPATGTTSVASQKRSMP